MPDPQIQLDSHAQQANGPYVHLVKWALEKYELFKESPLRAKKLKEAEECRKVYAQEAAAVSEPWEGASNITLPLTMITIDNMEPRLVAGLIGTAPYCRFEIEGQNELPPEDVSLQDWWNNELQDIVKIEDVAGDVCHDVQLDGTVFVLPRYSVEETTRRMMRVIDPQKIQQATQQLQKLSQVPPEQLPPEVAQQMQALGDVVNQAQNNVNGIVVGKNGRPIWADQKVKTFEGGKVDFLKFSDVFMPDDVDDDNYEEAPIIRRVYPTYASLMRDSQDESQSGWVKDSITSRLIGDESQEEKLEGEAKSPAQNIGDVEVSGKKTINCIECYVSYMYRKEYDREEDATDFTEERLVALIAEDSKLLLRLRLLREINPQNEHMVRRQTLFRERGCSYGTTVYHKMKSIQDGATRSFNLAINTGDIQLLPWGFYDGKSGLDKLKGDKGSIRLGIGKLLKIDNVDGIKFPTMNGNPSGFMVFLQTWMQFWEKAFNIGEMQIGVERTGAAETATASLAKIQEGNIAHSYRGKRSKAGFLGVIQTLWDLYFCWMPLDKTIKVNGEDVPINRQQMARGFKLRLTASSEMANKLIDRRQNEDFANITGLTKTPGIFNLVPVAEDLARSYGKDDPEKYVNPEVAQLNQVALQAPQLIPAMMQAAQQAMQLAMQIQEGGQRKAVEGMAGPQGGNGGGVNPQPPTGEAMGPKFAPQPQDVVKAMGV